MAVEAVEIRGCKTGLGIRIVGGRNVRLADGRQSDFGIFLKEVIADGLAAKDGIVISQNPRKSDELLFALCLSPGRLRKGDQLMEANGRSLVGVSNSE